MSSISRSITILVSVLSLIITVIYSGFVLAYSWIIEDNIFNRMVASEARHIVDTHQQDKVVYQPRSAFMELHSGWQELPSGIKEKYLIDSDQVEYELSDGKTIHLQVLVLGGQEYILTAHVEGFEVTRDYLFNTINWLVIFSLICCVLISLIALLIAQKITRPILRLAAAVKNKRGDDVLPGFANQYPNNEVRTLAVVIEESVLHLKAALARESNFTKDIGHEIRTPISVLKNLFNLNSESKSISQVEFQLAAKMTNEIAQTTQTLLALARNESSLRSWINLTELLENCILNHFELNHTPQGKRLLLNLEAVADVQIYANPNLVEIVINNLIQNMIHHASNHQVQVNVNESELIFTNQFNAPVPREPTESGQRTKSSMGLGQGLNLIKRVCEMSGWTIKVVNHESLFKVNINF